MLIHKQIFNSNYLSWHCCGVFDWTNQLTTDEHCLHNSGLPTAKHSWRMQNQCYLYQSLRYLSKFTSGISNNAIITHNKVVDVYILTKLDVEFSLPPVLAVLLNPNLIPLHKPRFGGEGVRKTASKIRTISVSWKDYMHVDDVIVCVVTRRGIVLKYGPINYSFH